MEIEKIPDNREQSEIQSVGANVIVRNYWVRHAQKESGAIFNAGNTSLSGSSITESGKASSFAYGEHVVAGKDGAQRYISDKIRTEQTLEKIVEGYQSTNPNAPVRSMRIREELISDIPKAFIDAYNLKFNVIKKQLLESRGLSDRDFATLSPDEQEHIAEAAEEPVLREWLDDPKSELRNLYSPSQAAARFARIFNRRHERLAHKLNSGSEIDVFHVTHKTIMEPFLASGVLVRKSNGARITKIEQLGGSLGILDNWESKVTTDSTGNPTVTVTFRGETYSVDNTVLEKLLELNTERKNEEFEL